MRPFAARSLLALGLVAFATPGIAAADERVEVTVTPHGFPWSVGTRGGQDCSPTCTIYVEPGVYDIHLGDSHETLPLRRPTALRYDAGLPKLRTIAGWAAVGGVGLGGALMGLGLWGWLSSCTGVNHCLDVDAPSRSTSEALILGAAGLITISVAGGIVFAVTSPSLSARDLAPSESAPRARPFDVLLAPSAGGGTLRFSARF